MSDIILYAPDYASVPVIQCSPPSWAVHMLLCEKHLRHQVVWLSFERGEHRSAEMLARNPRGTIPVLIDGRDPVFETYAILEYLELTYPESPFLPAVPSARALALTRFHEASHIKEAGMAVFAQLMRSSQQDKELWSPFDNELARWEEYLAHSQFGAGDSMGLADLILFTYVQAAAHLGWPLDGRPHLAAYSGRIASRPAVQASWPQPWR